MAAEREAEAYSAGVGGIGKESNCKLQAAQRQGLQRPPARRPHLAPVQAPTLHVLWQHVVPGLQHLLGRHPLQQAPNLHNVLISAAKRSRRDGWWHCGSCSATVCNVPHAPTTGNCKPPLPLCCHLSSTAAESLTQSPPQAARGASPPPAPPYAPPPRAWQTPLATAWQQPAERQAEECSECAIKLWQPCAWAYWARGARLHGAP